MHGTIKIIDTFGMYQRPQALFLLVSEQVNDFNIILDRHATNTILIKQQVNEINIGTCLDACNQLLDEVTAPEIPEALAIWCALTLACDEGMNKIIIASDCLSMVQRLNSLGRDGSLVGVVVEDIKMLATSLSVVLFRHINRLLSNSAHILACRVEQFVSSVFHNFVPGCIRFELCLDAYDQ